MQYLGSTAVPAGGLPAKALLLGLSAQVGELLAGFALVPTSGDRSRCSSGHCTYRRTSNTATTALRCRYWRRIDGGSDRSNDFDGARCDECKCALCYSRRRRQCRCIRTGQPAFKPWSWGVWVNLLSVVVISSGVCCYSSVIVGTYVRISVSQSYAITQRQRGTR